MKKFAILAAVVLVVGLVVTGAALAADGSQPSAKATAKVGDIAILNSTALGWTTILQNDIKTPNMKDLFIDVSLECGLYTDTLVKSKGGVADTSMAEAGVKVRVLVDEAVAYPGEVVFCNRMQQLMAKFGGIMVSCTDINGNGVITAAECIWTEEELQLILDTMNANAFNFILDDLGPGVHTIAVQARIDTTGSAQLGSFAANATIGNGSVTVEEVRLIKGEDICLE